jgi:hypothetical protein
MSFNYDKASYDAVLKAGNYKLSTVSMGGWGRTNAPVWWPKEDPAQSILYSRSQDDTAITEGYQFLEFMWHVASSGQVYFSKSYWD